MKEVMGCEVLVCYLEFTAKWIYGCKDEVGVSRNFIS